MPKNKTLDIDNLVFPGTRIIYNNDADKQFADLDGTVMHNVILVPLENEVFFPYMQIGSVMKHPDSIASLKKAFKDQVPVFLFLASDTLPDETKYTETNDVYDSFGTVAYLDDLTENADGSVTYRAVTSHLAKIKNLLRRSPYMRSDLEIVMPRTINLLDEEYKSAAELEKQYMKISSFLSENDRDQIQKILSELGQNTIRRIYFMMQNSPIDIDGRYELLKITDFSIARRRLLEMLKEEEYAMQIKAEINHKAFAEIGNRQREEILRTQLRQIKTELGETSDDDEDELRERANQKEWTDETALRFDKELNKLMRYNPTSPDYAIQYSYLDTFLNLPWLHCDNSSFELDEVENTLNRDHYGLDKVKERIIEQMAVLKLRGDTKAPILCLYGPPGVGKTSLGKSIAEALGRQYVRVALGGLHDEAEIRGHRRTYLGSMPGRIIAALEKCGTSDPVMVLDEIDKIGSDYKGDPAQALLEVLDPEQNSKFHDNYIDFDYDLSRVLFIATANTLQTISSPLLDRMELIEIGGYVEFEKIQIAQRHIIPKSLAEHGFHTDEIKFEDKALLEIIKSYTRESGVRQLEKKINEILRKEARLKASGKKMPLKITERLVMEYLGKPVVYADECEDNQIPGIVTGLAWTQSGGDILFIESSVAPGKEGKLTLTGNLGDVMKESAILALQYIKANYETIGIDKNAMEFGSVHIHVPEGAVPKDGPSAGITILTSLASTFSGRKVRNKLAMTGELTLRGKVLPVGGIKEKVLAAKRAGINTIILSSKNKKDIDEIKPEYLTGLKFHFVDSVNEVLDLALLPLEEKS